jgi:hypothetical protein
MNRAVEATTMTADTTDAFLPNEKAHRTQIRQTATTSSGFRRIDREDSTTTTTTTAQLVLFPAVRRRAQPNNGRLSSGNLCGLTSLAKDRRNSGVSRARLSSNIVQ